MYECSGAGQKVTQVTFGGRAWNELEDPRPMFEAFMAMRTLHELLALLDAALCLDLDRPLADRLASELVEVEETTFLGPKSLCELDVATIKRRCQHLLREVGSGLSEGGKP